MSKFTLFNNMPALTFMASNADTFMYKETYGITD